MLLKRQKDYLGFIGVSLFNKSRGFILNLELICSLDFNINFYIKLIHLSFLSLWLVHVYFRWRMQVCKHLEGLLWVVQNTRMRSKNSKKFTTFVIVKCIVIILICLECYCMNIILFTCVMELSKCVNSERGKKMQNKNFN